MKVFAVDWGHEGAALLPHALWIAAVAFLMRFELNDDAGVVAFLVLAITFVLGVVHPRHAWQWALLVGPCVPIVDLFFGRTRAGLGHTGGVLLLLAFVIGLGVGGRVPGGSRPAGRWFAAAVKVRAADWGTRRSAPARVNVTDPRSPFLYANTPIRD